MFNTTEGQVDITVSYTGAPVVNADGKVVDKVPKGSVKQTMSVARPGSRWLVAEILRRR